MEERTIHLYKAGLQAYRRVWDLQKSLQQQLIAGVGQDSLIQCQHPAVITHGRKSAAGHIHGNTAKLQKKRIHVIEVERGGDVTYHDDQQSILYPIINLRHHRQDVGWYTRLLEQVVIDSLEIWGITGFRVPGFTGVWVGDKVPENIRFSELPPGVRKIASLGVRISRWCTMHGIALNVGANLEGFRLITPCGIAGVDMTSLERERRQQRDTLPVVSTEEAGAVLASNFLRLFCYRPVEQALPW